MSSLVLARKWRPHTFDTVAGQAHVVNTLTHALNTQRLHHAYLFTGTRGVGKTSIARIFAKALSCEVGISANPCGKCLNCQEIAAGTFIDLIEIDAASRSKVEDTREILNNVLYPPTRGRFKIYIIDEIHMLSGHSFNALLKTLEEPPEHVKFLLATTDPKKLPITVLSRCLQFHLKNMLPHEIIAHCKDILGKENIVFEETALPWIAQAADGSLRDALSLLDQAIAYGQNEIKEINVRDMLGYIEIHAITRIVEALIARDNQQLLLISADLQHQGADSAYVLRELQNIFHQMTIAQCVPGYKTESSYAVMAEKLASQISAEDLQLFYQIALKGTQDLPFAPTPWIAFEMTLLRMLCFQVVDVEAMAPPHPNLPPPGGKELDRSPPAPQSQELPQKKEPESFSSTHKKNELGSSDSVESISNQSSHTDVSPTNEIKAQTITPIFEKNIIEHQTISDFQPAGVEKTVKQPTSILQPTAVEKSLKQPAINNLSWENILSALKLSGMAKNIAQHCTLENSLESTLEANSGNSEGNAKIILNIPAQQKAFLTDSIKQQLEISLADYFHAHYQKKISVAFYIAETALNSPAVKQQEQKKEEFNKAKTSLDNDPNFQKILNTFHGTIVPESITGNN